MSQQTPIWVGDLGQAPDPQHKKVQTTSQYLMMRDGVKIALDVMLPADPAPSVPLPAIMVMARYWRSFRLRMPSPPNRAPIGPREDVPDFLLARGFAVVVVDGRGSGASFGQSVTPFAHEEIKDYGEIASWVRQQDWCNGNIGAYGISYEGATALRLASTGVDAVKVVIPQELEFDVYTDITAPGGIFNTAFFKNWSDSNNALDNDKVSAMFPFTARLMVAGVRPVDADRKTRTLLKQAIQDHQTSTDVFEAMQGVVYRDDEFGKTGMTLEDFSVYHHSQGIQEGGALLFNWASWLDGAAAESALRTHNTYDNPQITIIGAWKHEMTASASPYEKAKGAPDPDKQTQWGTMASLFEQVLRDDKSITGKTIYYTTLGAGTWHKTEQFPLPNTDMQTWYFQADHSLAPQAPTADASPHSYTVNVEATTGTENRWHTQFARPVAYKNRAQDDARLLTYTSAPLAHDMTLTGYATLHLHVASSMSDGAFIVYLEDVDETGYVRYITEGHLRGIHRKLAQTDDLPYWSGLPPRTYYRADSQTLPVNEVVELVIGLQPTSVLLKRGHRLRIALAGADKDTFARIPAQGTPVWQVHHSVVYPSHVVLPVVKSG
jgi:putative CocE/NonD family hydrolase